MHENGAAAIDPLIDGKAGAVCYGGLDRSGNLELTGAAGAEGIFVIVVATITLETNDLTPIQQGFERLRQKFGKPSREEFHAHKMSEAMRRDVMLFAQTLSLRIGALIIDKAASLHDLSPGSPLPPPLELHFATTCYLLKVFLSRNVVHTLICDEDVQGRRHTQKFVTEVKRFYRERWDGKPIQVKHKASHQSDLIQLADIIAYDLARFYKGSSQSAEMRGLIEDMIKDARHTVEGPMAWNRAMG